MNDQASLQPRGAYRIAPWGEPLWSESKHLLMFAEQLQSKRQATMSSIRSHRLRMQLLLLLVVLGVAFIGILLYVLGTIDPLVYTIILGCYLLPLAAALAWTMGKASLVDLSARLRLDERALFEVVAMLQEKKNSLAKSEGWSMLQEAEFRVRLSRFDIGPSKMQG